MPDLPPELQQKIAQYQQVQQQLQAIGMQRSELDIALREVERTLEELEKVDEGTVLYKSAGSILIRAKDKRSIQEELSERKETLEIRVKSLSRQEKELSDRFRALQGDLNAGLQKAGLA